MSLFEKYLSSGSRWRSSRGLRSGRCFRRLSSPLAGFQSANVNFAVAILIWAMVWPMMIGVEFAGLRAAFARPKGLIITLIVNWLVKPFTMAALGSCMFFNFVFAGLDPPDDAKSYIAGSYPPRRGALYGDGLRLVAADKG